MEKSAKPVYCSAFFPFLDFDRGGHLRPVTTLAPKRPNDTLQSHIQFVEPTKFTALIHFAQLSLSLPPAMFTKWMSRSKPRSQEPDEEGRPLLSEKTDEEVVLTTDKESEQTER